MRSLGQTLRNPGPAAILLGGYPLVGYYGLTHWRPRPLALVVAVSCLVVVILRVRGRNAAASDIAAPLWLAALAIVAFLLDSHRLVLLVPVAINLVLLAVFWRSLGSGMPVAERFARHQSGELSDEQVRYCRRVTIVWCAFFAGNALSAGLLAVFAPLSWWALYTGLLSYVLVGLVFAAEYAVRIYRFPQARPFRGGTAGARDRATPQSWLAIREKGSVLGIRFLAAIATLFGRRVARLVLHVPVAYFVAFHPGVARVSREYLTRVRRQPATRRMIYRHVLCFARVTLDRIFLLQGRDALFQGIYAGHEHLARLHAEKRGAMLLSAHLGSSAAMRLGNRANRLHINVAGYFQNARMINSMLERLDPETTARVIHLNPAQVGSVLAIRERIAAGEMVALAADRIGVNERCVEVDFLGAPAPFPTAPFLLAAILRCPVYLVFGLYRDPNTYDLYCEPFEPERLVLPRGARDAALAACVTRYARRVEYYCRMYPYNWFNFFDFWAAHRSADWPAPIGREPLRRHA